MKDTGRKTEAKMWPVMLNLIQHLSTKQPMSTEIPAQGRND